MPMPDSGPQYQHPNAVLVKMALGSVVIEVMGLGLGHDLPSLRVSLFLAYTVTE